MTKLSFEEIEDCMPGGAVAIQDGWTGVASQWLHDFANAVAEKEREACAKLCERHAAEPLILRATKISERPFSGAALDCAELIRMRSNAGGNATERSEGRVDHNVVQHGEQ